MGGSLPERKPAPQPALLRAKACHMRISVGYWRRGMHLEAQRQNSSLLTCMGLFLSSGCFGFAVSSLFGAGRRFFVPSPGDQVRGGTMNREMGLFEALASDGAY